ncbi:phosphodiesterase [Dactylosporangium sucinum]|uniref:3',5'-cyclic adenosine monophosphate phosphodiesterase CpdA n=1 Tax=Dactylosporangium sucinum TaxID=1424081 RepID=A0A917WK00_9ACTN|nr:phosphodiesterase [Dactylosporangium sucinum]GGM09105.1 3',5'-cyclic adenosine monophosphate phosphodiesterase CpdA [Dactylosporangium sucinum]
MALIAHLSDPHITTGPLAAAPAEGLSAALTRVLALEPRPDCVVITGDLADRGRPEEYAVLRQLLAGYPLPVHLVTGNHDAREPLLTTLRLPATRYAADHPGFSVVVLDSLAPDLPDGGRLGDDQLAWLDGALAERAGTPVFVALHHPPIRVGIPGMDAIRLVDGPALAAVVARHPHVTRVLAGHLHRPVTSGFAGSTLTVAPSTYRQVELGMREGRPVGFVAEPAAFLLHWLDGGDCVTHTVPTSHTAAPVIAY